MVQSHYDWTVGHDLHFYKVLYNCISFILPGLAFLFFPIIAITCHCLLISKKNPKPTESTSDGNTHTSIKRSEYEEIDDNNSDDCSCSCSCSCSCVELLVKLTIGTSQFFFGPTTIKLKDKYKISYKEHCIKIGRRYYKLSLETLLPLVWSNACVLASLIAVFFAYFIIEETNNCDESLDCFLADESNTARITNCSMIFEKRVKVKCYEVYFQPLYALAFMGGLLKFVPILFRAVISIFLNKSCKKSDKPCKKSNERCKKSKKACSLCCIKIMKIVKIISFLVILLLVLGFCCALLFKHPINLAGLDYIQLNVTMKRLGLSMAVTAQISAIFIYPWHTLNEYVIEEIDLKIICNEQKEKIDKHHSISTPSNQESSK